MQEKVLQKYDIILVDHRTKRENLKWWLDNYPKYIDKGTKYIDKAFKYYDEGIKKFNEGLGSGLGRDKYTGKQIRKMFLGNKKEKL